MSDSRDVLEAQRPKSLSAAQSVMEPGREKQRAILKNWSYWPGDGPVLRGNVYEHPLLPDGLFIRTSRVLWIDTSIGIAETLNTVYILEGPRGVVG